MKNCKQIATEWGLSERTVNDLCKKNKIDGAIKVGKMWKIPDDAKKPIDGRITSGKYVRHSAGVTRKPLPIGISDYVRAQADYYYVDKTMLIKEFLDQKPLVSLFTRPRRFGKTLNMDMLRVFFEISEENTSKYFEDKAIWQCGEEYRNQQGQYPVVFLTFKDVKFDSWKATLDKIRDLLQEEFGRHQELATSERIAEYEKTYFAKIINGDASEVDLTASLAKLSQMLTKHYGKAPIIIIDEYDTPIQEGYSKDFYDEIIGFMRNFFSGAFKDNKNLTYGFLTGILRIAQESIFSGLNNLTVNSVMDEEYDQFFGFTVSEVREMLKYYGVLDKEEELKDWYDGYLFGSTEIYNPWSVINYISRGCIPQAYWVNTGKNEILEDVLKVATEDITERLYSLLQGERVIARIDQNVVYRSLSEDPANIYSLLLVAGYLKTPKKELQADGSYLCEVSIPNREIAAVSAIYEVLSNVIHGRQNPIYKDGQEISADVLEQGMREVSQYIPNKSYTDLINGTSTEILISSMSSDDLYHRIISIRLLFERVEGTLSLLRKKYPAACKFVNETNHVENDYIYQLDPRKYFGIPNYYLQQIENFIQENKETILAGNILTENTEVDQIGDN